MNKLLPLPKMDRLAKALAGDWDTLETMERGRFFPNGGSRHGSIHARLGAGGNVLIYEVSSDGSAGKLDGFHSIWWDNARKRYYSLRAPTALISAGCTERRIGRQQRS